MPPNGGLGELTNRHVSAAVAYVVDQGRWQIEGRVIHEC